MKTAPRVLAVSGLVVGGLMLGAASSQADSVRSYASEAHPVGKTHNHRTVWTWGYWRVKTISTGTKSYGTPRVRVTNPYSYPGFVRMTTQTNAGYCAAPQYVSCDAKYYTYKGVDSPGTHSNSWVVKTTITDVNPSASYARAYFNAKLSVDGRPDPTSGNTYVNGGIPY